MTASILLCLNQTPPEAAYLCSSFAWSGFWFLAGFLTARLLGDRK